MTVSPGELRPKWPQLPGVAFPGRTYIAAVDQFSHWFPNVSSMLAEAGSDVMVFTALSGAHCKQVWSNYPRSG